MRIVSFGCSLTYGEGITKNDCYPYLTKPSEYSWPNIIGRDLLNNKYEVINESWPGASNKLILYKIMNFDFRQDDIACIQFTFTGRDSLFKNEIKQRSDCNDFDIINPAPSIPTTSLSIKYYDIYDNYNLLINDLIYVNSIYEFIQNNKIKNICRFASNIKKQMGYDDCMFKVNKQFELDDSKETFYGISNKVDFDDRYGADNAHYSIKVNQIIAEEYYRELTNMV